MTDHVYAVQPSHEEPVLVARDEEELEAMPGGIYSFGQCDDCGSDSYCIVHQVTATFAGTSVKWFALCNDCGQLHPIRLTHERLVCA